MSISNRPSKIKPYKFLENNLKFKLNKKAFNDQNVLSFLPVGITVPL